MRNHVTSDDIHAWLKDHFRQRHEVGFGKALLNSILQNRNPFEPEKRRRPKVEFVVGVGLFVTAAACFVYFNFAH